MKIGLFGFGCVASGVYEALKSNPQLGSIQKICIKNSGKMREAPRFLFTTHPDEILNDPEIDLIIELVDDAVFAFSIIKKSLESGKPVISANKKMIAENLQRIVEIQVNTGCPIMYEGAVAGSIPIIHLLNSFYKNQEIKSIRGIINGSTNFILSEMYDNETSYEKALNLAQKLGFAESDPYLDISGLDAFYKLQILSYEAFGKVTGFRKLIVEGIQKISDEDISNAKALGNKIKLLIELQKQNGELYGSVKPVHISSSDPFFKVDGEFNAIEVESDLSGIQVYYGKGAGSLPTASAVIQDIHSIQNSFLSKKTNKLSA